MNNKSTYFVKYDFNNQKLCIKTGSWKKFFVMFILIFILFERTFIECGISTSVIYVIDFINICLLVSIVGKKVWKQYFPLLVSYFIIVFLGMGIAIFNYAQWEGNLLFSIIEIRSMVRFPIFFLACVICLDEITIKKIFRILTVFFYVNSVYILYQYVTYHPPGVWMRGDLLNGFFGTTTGGNTYVNVLMICVVSYWLCQWSQKKCSLYKFVVPLMISVAIAALIELKMYFIEVAIIYIWYIVTQKKSIKVILQNVVVIVITIMVGSFALQYMYEEYPWFRDTMSLAGLFTMATSGGYSNEMDLNRLTGIFTVASDIFKYNPFDVLFGIGLGNGSVLSIGNSMTSFAKMYAGIHYSWFSAVYLFVQTGAIGLISYIFTFVYFFIKKKKNASFSSMSQVLSILAILLLFYGEALKTDAGYFVYFAIACGFVYESKEIKIKSK